MMKSGVPSMVGSALKWRRSRRHPVPQLRESHLHIYKGAKIPSFGTFKWVSEEGRGVDAQKVVLRPVFRLSDSFCKTYGVTNKGADVLNRPSSKVKEINIYEVARSSLDNARVTLWVPGGHSIQQ